RIPLVLVLDDLHWADSASLDLLSHLGRHAGSGESGPGAGLLVAGSYRPAHAEENPALQSALLEWTRLRVLTTISVHPLPKGDIGWLARGVLHSGDQEGDIHPAVTALLFSQSEGNPFFAEELLSGWLEEGALSNVDGRWSFRSPESALDIEHSPPGTSL